MESLKSVPHAVLTCLSGPSRQTLNTRFITDTAHESVRARMNMETTKYNFKYKPWYLYVVQCSDGTLYTGVTTDIDRRIDEHNTSSRGAKYTKARRPVKLVYKRRYANRSEAQSAEYQFKKLLRGQKLQIIKNSA